MNILDSAKDMIRIDPISLSLSMPKSFSKRKKIVGGTLHIIAKQHADISSISFKVLQHAKLPTKNEGETHVIGSKNIRPNLHIEMLHKERLPFELEVSWKEAKKVEKKVYTGDLALLDKVSDQSKKTFYTFTLEVRVKLKSLDTPIIKTKTIEFE